MNKQQTYYVIAEQYNQNKFIFTVFKLKVFVLGGEYIQNIQGVHCAGLSGVSEVSQNVLSADPLVSPGKLKVIHSVIT
jgi:thiamine monophosphate synthase